MKVGDYVRNKYGIAKIINIKNNNGIDVLTFDKNICFLVNKETGKIKDDKLINQLAIIEGVDINKIKSSPNIIDLIEVGDMVNYEQLNGGYVLNKRENEIDTWAILPNSLKNKDIKSVITREQLITIQYKVGE